MDQARRSDDNRAHGWLQLARRDRDGRPHCNGDSCAQPAIVCAYRRPVGHGLTNGMADRSPDILADSSSNAERDSVGTANGQPHC